GDLRNACNARQDLGFVLTELGAYEDAEPFLRQSLVDAERMGILTTIPEIKQNLGLSLMGQGKLEEAAGLERQVVEAGPGQGRRRVEGLAETYLARILLRKGESGAAEEAVRRAVGLLDVAPVSRSMALAVLARTLLAKGRNEEAIVPAREAMDLLRSLGALEEGEALVRLTFAEALAAVGDNGAAAAIAEAKNALTARAKNIENPKFRKSFLERVEENAATLALASS